MSSLGAFKTRVDARVDIGGGGADIQIYICTKLESEFLTDHDK